jgi:hypothetical protein
LVCDLDDIHDMFYLRAQKKGLQFVLKRGDDLPHHLKADGKKIRQILIKLLNPLGFELREAVDGQHSRGY